MFKLTLRWSMAFFALTLMLFASSAAAEIMEDISVRPLGNDAAVYIRFVVPVQLVRTIGSSSNELTQVYYDMRSGVDQPPFMPGERRQAGGGALPLITVTDEPAQAGETSSIHRRLIVGFDTPVDHTVRGGPDPRTLLIVLSGMAHAIDKMVVSSAAVPKGKRYMISLQRSDKPDLDMAHPLPKDLQDYQLFTLRKDHGGRPTFHIALGYFETIAQAEAALTKLREFPNARIVSLFNQGESDAAALQKVEAHNAAPPTSPPLASRATAAAAAATAPLPETLAATPAAPVDVARLPANAQASAMLAAANTAYEKGRLDEAKQLLNQILSLPPNLATPDAQELIGRVRLAQGDNAQARAEFESYLRQFPNSATASRVRDTLMGMSSAGARPLAAAPATGNKNDTQLNLSVGQYYYGGKSSVQTLNERNADGTPIDPNAIGSVRDSTVSSVDQNQLQSNVDLNWRHRQTDADERFVFRDNYRRDFHNATDDKNRLTALYYDYKSLPGHWGARIGRQSGLGGGVLGRYDGLYDYDSIWPHFKVSTVVGEPSDQIADSHRYFAGAGIDADRLFKGIGGSLFAIQQMIDGEVDRRAIGGDVRYFSPTSSVFGVWDYDLIYKVLNVASAQGTYTLEDKTSFNLLAERRAVAYATLGNNLFFQDPSLPSFPRTIRDLIDQGKTIAQLRQQVSDNMAYTKQALLTVMRPVSMHWQAGATAQFSRTSAIAPNPVLVAGQPDTGNQWTTGLQFIGTNLYSKHDTHLFNISFVKAPTFTGRLLTYNNLSAVTDAWQLEPSMRFQLNDDISGHSKIYAPGFRVSYHPAKSWTLESNLSVEITRKTTLTGSENTNRVDYYLGYRYDY